MDKETEENQIKVDAQDQILLAALRLFTEKGYFNTSLNDIVDAAGLKTTSALYQHFKNKQTIAAALYANIFDSLNISIDDIRRRNQKPSEQLRGIVDLFFRLTDEAPDVMLFLLVLNHKEILPDEKPVLETAPFLKIIKIIQAGTKTGEIRAIAPELAFAYFFGIVNTTLRMVLSGELDKKADTYHSPTWLSAWSAIAKK